MSFQVETRLSDSPYIDSIMHGYALHPGSTIRPAETHWYMVLTKVQGTTAFLVVGPWSKSGIVHCGSDAEILWIRFKLGVFMPHRPTRTLLNSENPLPPAAGHNIWLKSSAWQLPDYENADTFVDRLVRDDILVHDPVVSGVLSGQLNPQTLSPRTVRHRFLQATGLTQSHIAQHERAQKAVTLLQSGCSILDTVFEAGYFDQPHMTRALRQFIGYTPAQIASAALPK